MGHIYARSANDRMDFKVLPFDYQESCAYFYHVGAACWSLLLSLRYRGSLPNSLVSSYPM